MSRYSWFDSLADKLRADLESATHGGVSSVNGSSGDVVLTASDVSAQPASAALTGLAGLDSSQSGVIASDGAGWLSKTYATLKTALSLVKGDVGLGNVDNTSDANKPVSTAQQTALNLKAPLASPALTGTPTAPTAAPGTNSTQLASTAYADAAAVAAAVGLLDYRGTFNASGNAFPASGGSGSTGALLKGDFWIVSTPGTLGGTAVSNGDLVIALIDAPGTTAANWDLIEHDVGYAPENVANKSTDGTLAAASDTLYPSQKAAKAYADSKASPLTRTAVKVGNYAATMWDLVPCDTSGGAFTVTLPAASGGKGRVAIKLVTAGNTLNLALTGSDHFNTSGGPTTGTLTLANQGLVLESDGSGIWTITADDVSLTALDGRFLQISNAAPLALAGQTPSQAPVAAAGAGAVGSLAFTARADHVHPFAGLTTMTPKTGQFWVPPGGGGVASNGVPTYQSLQVVPIYIPATITFTGIYCYCDTAVASSVARLGIYGSDAQNQPGSLILDAGTVSTATTGAQGATISQSLSQGIYWLAVAMQAVTGAKLRAFQSYTNPFGLIPADASQASAPDKQVWGVAGATTGALPTSPTFAPGNSGNQGPALLFLKV